MDRMMNERNEWQMEWMMEGRKEWWKDKANPAKSHFSKQGYEQILAKQSCYIALENMLFSIQKYLYFSYFSTKTYVMGTH